jgi:hypothetical protein
MSKERTGPVTSEDGDERHPAFGVIAVHRVHTMPGEVLFQSDVRHQEYIRLTVHEAVRKRKLHHDWVHAGKLVCEVSMSMTQFASFIASVGTEGVPCTIEFTDSGANAPGARPGLNPASRLAFTTEEVRAAAVEAYKGIQEALKAYEETLADKGSAAVRRAALGTLRAAVANAVPNVAYAAKTLDEHAEAVVDNSRADIEAMVVQMAERLGVSPAEVLAINPVQGGETVG